MSDHAVLEDLRELQCSLHRFTLPPRDLLAPSICLICSAKNKASLRHETGDGVTDLPSNTGGDSPRGRAREGWFVCAEHNRSARAPARCKIMAGRPGSMINLLLSREKMRQAGRREGRRAGLRNRAFYATAFEKRTSLPALWAFLHCASTSLV